MVKHGLGKNEDQHKDSEHSCYCIFFFFIPDIFCQMRFKNTVETDSSTGKKRGGERNSITPQRNYKVFTVLRLVADE